MVAYDAVAGLGAVHVRLDEQLARLLARHHHLDGRAHDARDQTRKSVTHSDQELSHFLRMLMLRF